MEGQPMINDIARENEFSKIYEFLTIKFMNENTVQENEKLFFLRNRKAWNIFNFKFLYAFLALDVVLKNIALPMLVIVEPNSGANI
jgi:hypothetical protein